MSPVYCVTHVAGQDQRIASPLMGEVASVSERAGVHHALAGVDWFKEGRINMRNGYRVFDADTHVSPAAEVLENYVDPGFRPRLAELAQYRQASGEGRHHYSFGRKFYRRVLGEAEPREDFTGRGGNGAAVSCPGRGFRTIRPRTASRTWMTRGPTSIS